MRDKRKGGWENIMMRFWRSRKNEDVRRKEKKGKKWKNEEKKRKGKRNKGLISNGWGGKEREIEEE